MIFKPRLIAERLRSSLWVVPLGVVTLMIAAAYFLQTLDARIEFDLVAVAGASVDGARGMLQAVATSTITVAGVVFSLTLLALSQAGAQYSPRVLRNFLRDRITQSVLGILFGVYAYCLVVLSTMDSDPARLPGLAIVGGLVAAFLSLVYLIYFFHHIADSLQLETILADIEAETLPVICRLYSDETLPDDDVSERTDAPQLPTLEVRAKGPGYIQDIELDALVHTAERFDGFIVIPPCVGDFILQGKVLALASANSAPDPVHKERIAAAISLGLTRSIQQDPEYGIRQMVDVAIKALSPGVNDTTNAIMVLDRISVLMKELTVRDFPHRCRFVNGHLRLVIARPSFADLMGLSFDQIRQWGTSNPAVLGRLLEVLRDLLVVCPTFRRRALIRDYARRVIATAQQTLSEPGDLAWVQNRYKHCMAIPPINIKTGAGEYSLST